MKTEEYVNKIIEETGLSKKDIEDLVKKQKEELRGLISDEGALFVIAKGLGVDVATDNKNLLSDIELNISDITVNMKNIILIGRIKELYRKIKFKKSNGEEGYVGSFLLHDETGDVRVVIWDEIVNIFNDERFKVNELVKIINGYAKEGRYGDREVHIGKFGKVVIAPEEDIDYKKFPMIKEKFINIRDIKEGLYTVSIEGKIENIYPSKEFTKRDGQIGKVKSLKLRDITGTVRISFWNSDIDKLNSIDVGDYISLSNLNIRKNSFSPNLYDLHATSTTNLSKINKELKIDAKFINNIKDLEKEDNLVSFQGIITSIDDLKRINLKTGEEVSLLKLSISDNTGAIRVNIWRDKADKLSKSLKNGEGIYLKNVMVKYNDFTKGYEISLIPDSVIEKKDDLNYPNLKMIDQPFKEQIKSFFKNFTRINSIKSPGFYEIKGYIPSELNKIRLYEACSNCNKKFENCSCEKSGSKIVRMIINQAVEDESGRIRATFIGEVAEKFVGISADKVKQLIDSPDYNDFLNNVSNEIIGKDFMIKGKAKFNDVIEAYEIIVSDFQELNIEEELDHIIKEI